jgi:thioredoxin 1
MNEIYSVNYELALAPEEAAQGTNKILIRNNKRLEVNIPPGVTTGSTVKLSQALQLTDDKPGDILIQIKVKAPEFAYPGDHSAVVIAINDSTFESEVLNARLPVVVDFWAPWCGPCRIMSPIMDKLATQYHGKFKFCKINVDENPAQASQYQAMSIPMLLIFKNGVIIERSVGALPEAQLKAKLDSIT